VTDTGPVSAEDKPLWHHPNIREMAIAQLTMRADERRARRLFAAIETQNLKVLKLEKMADKDIQKFVKTVERASKRLEHITDELIKLNQEISTATQLHNQATLLSEQLG